MRDEQGQARGQYRTAGFAVGFVGLVGLLGAGMTSVIAPQDLGFIDQRSMVGISMVFLVVAYWMVTWDGAEGGS